MLSFASSAPRYVLLDASTLPSPLLPPSVLLKILSHLVPPPSFNRFASRSLQPRKLGFVSHAWHAVAQPELLAHPVLRTKRGVRKLLERLKVDPRVGEEMLSLGIGSPDRGSEPMQLALEIGELLRLCPNVEEVRLTVVWYMRWGSFQGCRHFRALHCWRTRFVPDLASRTTFAGRELWTQRLLCHPKPSSVFAASSPLHLPSLEQVTFFGESLGQPTRHHSLPDFTRSNFPALVFLAVSYGSYFSEFQALLTQIQHLAYDLAPPIPHTFFASLNDALDAALPPLTSGERQCLLKDFTAVTHLASPLPTLLDLLVNLPSRPTHLHITTKPTQLDSPTLLAALFLPSTIALQSLSVPSISTFPLNLLREECERRRIRIIDGAGERERAWKMELERTEKVAMEVDWGFWAAERGLQAGEGLWEMVREEKGR